jgi:DNA-binding response OmpR family regulator
MQPVPGSGSARNVLHAAARYDDICAYAERGALEARLREALQREKVLVYECWTTFQRVGLTGASAATCILVDLRGPLWEELLRLRVERTSFPILLLTRFTRENARALAAVSLDQVLFLDEATEPDIVSAIRSVRRRSLLHAAAATLRANPMGLDPELAETLARACSAPIPIRTVHELARLMGCSRSTVARRWSAAAAPASPPHRFIEWLLLMHALLIRTRTQSAWPDIARGLLVQEKTLRNTGWRLFNCALGDLERADASFLAEGLWRQFRR